VDSVSPHPQEIIIIALVLDDLELVMVLSRVTIVWIWYLAKGFFSFYYWR
jgi:hypothetical protein